MKRTIVGLILALVLAVGMGLPVMAGTPPAPSLTPSTVTATIAPGGSTQITKIVQTPTIAPNLDVVFLCDTTGSMGGVISAMQTNASTIMTSILAGSSTAEFAVGEYKDKTNYPADPFDFKLDQMMTANTSLVTAGINSWATILGSGGDIPEEQLYALDQIAATSIGFRTGSTRIIVWMGDDPGHDQSIDPPAAGGMTLTTCIAALTGGANAPIKVIAIPVNDSDEGLDFTGQATAITSATGGQLMPAATPDQVAAAILSALTSLQVTVAMTSDATAPLSTTFTPTSQKVTSGSTATFTETISVAVGAVGGTYKAKDWALINGNPMVDNTGAIIYENKTITVSGVPSSTTGVGTGATVSGGGGGLPFVKASWVQEPDNNITAADGHTIISAVNSLESGDPNHNTAGTQINPPVLFNASKTIDFFAVVSDPAGVANLSAAVGGDVFGYVFSPANSPLPYSTPIDPTFGAPDYKFKTEFTYDLGSGSTAIAALTAAYNAHLVNFGPVAAQDPNIAQEGAVLGQNYTFANLHNSSLTGELDKHVAELYEGVGVLTYEQPAGTYSIDVYAIDKSGNVSVKLTTPFYYLPIPAVETDFTSITYGNVSLRVPLTIPGDVTWGNNIATVRNIGNTWVQVTVAQDDMGFGKAGTQVATAYKGTVPPVFSSTPSGNQSNWNVYFDAILGTNVEMYFDPTAKGSPVTNVVTLPGVLDLSTMNELDFSIFVNDGMGTHSGSLTISAVSVPFVAGTVPPLMGGVNTQSSEPSIIPISPVVTTP